MDPSDTPSTPIKKEPGLPPFVSGIWEPSDTSPYLSKPEVTAAPDQLHKAEGGLPPYVSEAWDPSTTSPYLAKPEVTAASEQPRKAEGGLPPYVSKNRGFSSKSSYMYKQEIAMQEQPIQAEGGPPSYVFEAWDTPTSPMEPTGPANYHPSRTLYPPQLSGFGGPSADLRQDAHSSIGPDFPSAINPRRYAYEDPYIVSPPIKTESPPYFVRQNGKYVQVELPPMWLHHPTATMAQPSSRDFQTEAEINERQMAAEQSWRSLQQQQHASNQIAPSRQETPRQQMNPGQPMTPPQQVTRIQHLARPKRVAPRRRMVSRQQMARLQQMTRRLQMEIAAPHEREDLRQQLLKAANEAPRQQMVSPQQMARLQQMTRRLQMEIAAPHEQEDLQQQLLKAANEGPFEPQDRVKVGKRSNVRRDSAAVSTARDQAPQHQDPVFATHHGPENPFTPINGPHQAPCSDIPAYAGNITSGVPARESFPFNICVADPTEFVINGPKRETELIRREMYTRSWACVSKGHRFSRINPQTWQEVQGRTVNQISTVRDHCKVYCNTKYPEDKLVQCANKRCRLRSCYSCAHEIEQKRQKAKELRIGNYGA